MSAYSSLILAHGSLKAYYRLGEGSGTTLVDAGPNGLNGTYAGSGITWSTGAVVTDSDTAATFSGGVDPATVADNNALDLGNGPFSIECWVKRATSGVGETLIAKGQNGYSLAISAGNAVELQMQGVGTVASSSTTITDTNWHHIVATKNGSARKIWIDSVDRTSLGTDQTLTDTAIALMFGFASAGVGRFTGSLDEVALYNAVLTQAEVRSHYIAGALSFYAQLVASTSSLAAYYRLNEPSGTVLTDTGSNGLNGTLSATGTTYGVTGPLVNDSDKALTFDGTGDPGSVPDNNALDLGDVWTVEFWVKRSATQGAVQVLVSKQPGGTPPTTSAYELRFTTGNRIAALQSGGTTLRSSTVITDQNWHHVVFTKNGSTRNMYVDGAADNAVAGTNATTSNNTSPLLIGTGSGTARFPGSMDEVAVYNAELTAAEVLQHYRTGLGAMTLTDTATLSDTPSKEPGVVVADTATLSDAQAKDVGQGLSDTATLSDANAKDVGQALSDSVGPTDATGNAPGTFPADSVTLSDATSSEPGLVKADTVTLSDNESAESGLGASLSDSVTPTDSQAADVGQSLSDTATLSDAYSAADAIVIADTVTLSDNLTAAQPIMQAVDDSVSLFDMLSTHLETEGAGGGQQPGFGMVRVPVTVRDTRLSFADVLLLTDSLDLEADSHLTDSQREEELLALI